MCVCVCQCVRACVRACVCVCVCVCKKEGFRAFFFSLSLFFSLFAGGSVQSDIISFCFETTKTLVFSLVLSRFDDCNALLAGFPQVLFDKTLILIYCSARLFCKDPKSSPITPLLVDIHWLPVSSRIQILNSSHLLPHCLWYSSSIPL